MTIKGLLERKSAVYTEMMALAHNARKENRSFTDEEKIAFDKADKDYNDIVETIERMEKSQAYEADFVQKDEQVNNQPQASKEERYAHAFNKYLRYGNGELTAAEKQLLVEERVNESDNNAKGAFTVSTVLYDQFVETMKYFAPILNEVNLLRTASGQKMDFTTFNETNKSAAFITGGQGSTVNETEMDFGTASIDVHTAATMVKLSWELLQDNEFNLEGELGRLLGERVGRLLEEVYTNGTGTNQPFGILTDAGAGVTAASASVITRNEIINLIHSIDPAYRARGAKFMFNDSTLAAFKQLTIGTGDARPLWVPSMREGEPDTLEGFSYVINQAMPDIATGDTPIVFGEMNCYYAREAGSVSLRRLDERFADSLVSGFLLYGRYGGKLLKSDAVKKITMA